MVYGPPNQVAVMSNADSTGSRAIFFAAPQSRLQKHRVLRSTRRPRLIISRAPPPQCIRILAGARRHRAASRDHDNYQYWIRSMIPRECTEALKVNQRAKIDKECLVNLGEVSLAFALSGCLAIQQLQRCGTRGTKCGSRSKADNHAT